MPPAMVISDTPDVDDAMVDVVLVIPDDPEGDVAMTGGDVLGCKDDLAVLRSDDAGTPPGLVVPAYSGGAASGSAFDIVEREFIEFEILGNFDVMLVDYANRKSCDGSPAWCKLTGLLCNLGYDFVSDCCWNRLGIAKYEGPDPSKQLIGRRGSIATDILGSVPDTSLRPEEIAIKARWTVEMSNLTSMCLSELREVARVRKQSSGGKKDRLQRWAEASPMVIEHILNNLDKPSLCLLGLSNILESRIGNHSTHAIASTKVARATVGRLLIGGSSTIEALGEMGGKGALLWSGHKRRAGKSLRRVGSGNWQRHQYKCYLCHTARSSTGMPPGGSIHGHLVTRAANGQVAAIYQLGQVQCGTGQDRPIGTTLSYAPLQEPLFGDPEPPGN
jgi:hypothetical protein